MILPLLPTTAFFYLSRKSSVFQPHRPDQLFLRYPRMWFLLYRENMFRFMGLLSRRNENPHKMRL